VLLALGLARLGGAPLRALLRRAERRLLAPRPRSFAVVVGVVISGLALAVGYTAFRLHPVSVTSSRNCGRRAS
jgi:hypothetical protein